MTHTQQTIESITLDLLRGSSIGVTGGFYQSGDRPLNSVKNDVVVGLVSGTSEQIQVGYINVNVYVPKLFGTDGVLYVDRAKCQTFEQRLTNVVAELNAGGLVFYEIFGFVKTITEPTTKYSVVSAQLKFKFLND